MEDNSTKETELKTKFAVLVEQMVLELKTLRSDLEDIRVRLERMENKGSRIIPGVR